MNAGRLLGELQLRVYQLEEALEVAGVPVPPEIQGRRRVQEGQVAAEHAPAAYVPLPDGRRVPVVVPPVRERAAPVPKSRRRPRSSTPQRVPAGRPGIWSAIHQVLVDAGRPLGKDEIAAALSGFERDVLAKNIDTRASQGYLERIGAGRAATFRLPQYP